MHCITPMPLEGIGPVSKCFTQLPSRKYMSFLTCRCPDRKKGKITSLVLSEKRGKIKGKKPRWVMTDPKHQDQPHTQAWSYISPNTGAKRKGKGKGKRKQPARQAPLSGLILAMNRSVRSNYKHDILGLIIGVGPPATGSDYTQTASLPANIF